MKNLHRNIVLPSPEQVEWSDAEIGVIIHIDLPTFHPGYNFQEHWGDCIPAQDFNPTNLDTDQWIKAAADMGARYAVLPAKQAPGFSLWPTKAHEYSVKNSPWKNGQGDIVRDFVNSCKKYGLRPGLYCSVCCNQYYDVEYPGLVRSRNPEKQKEYNRMVETQLTELWTEYGDLFEIWFDGGCIPVEEGGPNVVELLHQFQPNAVVFQGPEGTKSLLRWCGNESAIACENCSAIFNYQNQDADGLTTRVDTGNTFGDIWCPVECDMPNRVPSPVNSGGWLWVPNEENNIFSAATLFDRYLRSVGHNGNLLLGMAIDQTGLFPKKDAEIFSEFGANVRRVFGSPLCKNFIHPAEGVYELKLPLDCTDKVGYIAIGEDICFGERITAYTLSVFDRNQKECFHYDGQIISHKKIFELPPQSFRAVLTVHEAKDDLHIKQFAFYRK